MEILYATAMGAVQGIGFGLGFGAFLFATDKIGIWTGVWRAPRPDEIDEFEWDIRRGL